VLTNKADSQTTIHVGEEGWTNTLHYCRLQSALSANCNAFMLTQKLFFLPCSKIIAILYFLVIHVKINNNNLSYFYIPMIHLRNFRLPVKLPTFFHFFRHFCKTNGFFYFRLPKDFQKHHV